MRYTLGARRRLAVGLVGAGTLVSLILFVVLPAMATPPGAAILPPSIPKNVTPVDVATGGQSNDCAVFHSTAANQYRISNPKTGTYRTTVGNVQVTFTLTMNPPNTNPPRPAYANDKYVSISSTGAAIVDIGIKGGTDSARYNYTGLFSNPTYAPGISSDGYLHAPAQSVDGQGNPTSLYSVSNLTFCFDLAGSASGKVYADANENSSPDAGETGLAGWTVNLRDNADGSPVSTTTSASDGTYSFSLPFNTSTTYRICEAPPSTDANAWAQTEPLPSSPNICDGSRELPKGYTFKPSSATQSITGQDFGNVGAQPCQAGPFGIPGTYVIQLARCKPNATYAFSSTPGVIDGDTSTPAPYVSVFASDETQQDLVPLVEKITLPFTIKPPGTAQPLITLGYDDTFPFSIADALANPMPFCKLDPRVDGSDFDLQGTYADPNNVSQVLPSGATSCLIFQSESATRPDQVNHPDQGTYTAYVYSELDGLRGVSP